MHVADESDRELLGRFARERSEAAIGELVRRYFDFVYSAALRQVGGDGHLAKDVAQEVFLALSRKAPALAERESLAGWLYRATRFRAGAVVRAECRRRDRESAHYRMNEIEAAGPKVEWDGLRPILDEAMHELRRGDMDALLMRFFENRSLAEVGARLGLTENSAQKHVERALIKLRGRLARRGIQSTPVALATVIGQHAVSAAPARLASATSAMLAATPATTVVVTLLAFMSTTAKSKFAAAGLAFVLASAGVATWAVKQNTERANLERENATLRRQNWVLLGEHNQRLAAETKKSAPSPAPGAAEAKKPARTSATRGVSSDDSLSGLASGAMVPLAALKNVGRANPRATLETLQWAIMQGDVDLASDAIGFAPGAREQMQAIVDGMPEAVRGEFGTPEHAAAVLLSGSPSNPKVTGLQILDETQDDPSDTTLKVMRQFADGSTKPTSMTFHNDPTAGWQRVIATGAMDKLSAEVSQLGVAHH